MKQILLLVGLLTGLSLSAQTGITKVFEMSPNYDLGTTVLPNGDGYAVFGAHGGASLTNGDIFLLRLDKDGNEIGRHYFGLPNRSEGVEDGVLAIGNDGFLIAGWQYQGNARFGYLVRVAANGSQIWSKTLSGNGFSGLYFTCLAALPSGGYMAAGSNNGSEMVVVRLSDNGDVVWKKSYNAERAQSICLSENGGNCFLASRNKVFKVRTSDGQLVWEKPIKLPVFGAPDGDVSVDLYDIKSMGNGQFAIAGTALNDEIFSFEQASYASLWKENGTIQWANAYPVDPATGMGGVTGNSLFYLPNQQQMLLTGEGQQGVAITRIDLSGHQLDLSDIPTPGACVFPVLMKYQGKYVVTGGDFQGKMNTLFYRSEGNWLPAGNQRPIERDFIATSTSVIYPNPARTTIQFDYNAEVAADVSFQIFNSLGQRVLQTEQYLTTGSHSISINIEHLPKGAYWLRTSDATFLVKGWLKE